MSSQTAKICLLGNSYVGKSCLSVRFIQDRFSDTLPATVGAAFQTVYVKTDAGISLKLEIWDTAGHERFRSLAPMYYRGAAAVIVVFDLTSRKTLEGVKYWMDELQKNGPANAVVALVGNKADLAKQMREVGENEGEEYAESLGAFYKETSARTGYNVQELFKELCRRLEKPELQVAADSGLNEDGIIGDSGLRVRLHDRTKHPRRGCCS